MKYILYLFILGVFAAGITSCDSGNPSSSGSTAKELEVTPSKTSVGIYEKFTVKARMTNTPLSDVYMKIDLGDGQVVQPVGAGSDISHSYDKTGTYTVTVTAFDSYTDVQIASKTITIIVSDVIPTVTFTRDLIDTTLTTRSDGTLGDITFSYTTNAPVTKARFHWGDGRMDSLPYYNPKSMYYESSGTFKVIVDIYNDKGDYWASDTMTLIIRLPEVTFDMLTTAYNVSVSLAPDGSSPIYQSVKTMRHIDAGLGYQNDTTGKSTISWNGNTFTVSRLYIGSDTISSLGDINNIFTGTLSSDLKKLVSMNVSISDSLFSNKITRYGYQLSNLELCGVNDEVVIYRAAYRALSSFTSNEYFGAYSNSSYTNASENVSAMLRKCVQSRTDLPYAYVVFTRK